MSATTETDGRHTVEALQLSRSTCVAPTRQARVTNGMLPRQKAVTCQDPQARKPEWTGQAAEARTPSSRAMRCAQSITPYGRKNSLLMS